MGILFFGSLGTALGLLLLLASKLGWCNGCPGNTTIDNDDSNNNDDYHSGKRDDNRNPFNNKVSNRRYSVSAINFIENYIRFIDTLMVIGVVDEDRC